jgi:hypothetical protein
MAKKFQQSARMDSLPPNLIDDIVDGFKNLDGERIKPGLKSFQVNLGT